MPRSLHITCILEDCHLVAVPADPDFELDEYHMIKNEKVASERLRVRQNVFLVQHSTENPIT